MCAVYIHIYVHKDKCCKCVCYVCMHVCIYVCTYALIIACKHMFTLVLKYMSKTYMHKQKPHDMKQSSTPARSRVKVIAKYASSHAFVLDAKHADSSNAGT
jgi:hypothetical protein